MFPITRSRSPSLSQSAIATAEALQLDQGAARVFQLLRRRIHANWLALEHVDFTGPRAGNDVLGSVAIDVHQLWTKTDASPSRHFAVGASRLEPPESAELRSGVDALIPIDAELSVPKLPDQQVGFPVPIKVSDERRGMANLDIDGLSVGLDAERGAQFAGWSSTVAQRRAAINHPMAQLKVLGS